MAKLVHIINTVSKEENEELYRLQKITLSSIIKAKEYCEFSNNISLFSIGFTENNSAIPAEFKQLASLTNNTSKMVSGTKRQLPFIKDILESALKYSDADYFIYSNLDIAFMPFFYDSILNFIEEGYDAMVINRRRIKEKFSVAKSLEVMYSESGEKHPGYDCFVIKREVLQKFNLKYLSLGVPPMGNDLFHNVFTFGNKPVLFSEKHLTFHIGTIIIKNWGEPEIEKHNYKEYKTLLKELAPLMDANKFPGAEMNFFTRHFKWLMNFTFSYPLMLRLDLRRGFKRNQVENQSAIKKQPYVEWLVRKAGFRDP